MTHRPPNVPQRHAIQATHARYAVHARTFFLGDFVSVENKGKNFQIPKLKVASFRPRRPLQSFALIRKMMRSNHCSSIDDA